MRMKIRKNNKLPFPVFLAGLLLVVGWVALSPRFLTQKSQKAVDNAKYTEIQQLADALQNDPKYRDKESQAYKEARQRFCLLSVRPAEQREKAVVNIREFLGKPTVNVDFVCSKFEGNDYTKPKIEYYNAALFGFTVDPETNYIVEVRTEAWEGSQWGHNKDGSRWFAPQPEIDYTPRYTQAQAREVAEKFIADHKDILGVDLAKMTLDPERVGTKPGNYFFGWINEQGSVNLTITSGGQVIVYSNELGRQTSK